MLFYYKESSYKILLYRSKFIKAYLSDIQEFYIKIFEVLIE